MADISEGAVGSRTTTAYFETSGAANAAVKDLVARGIPREQISIVGMGAHAAGTSKDRSLSDDLKDLVLPAADRYAYADALRRGGVVVSVRAEALDYESVLDVLNRHGAVDLEKRQANWRDEGWTGYPDPDAAAISPHAGVPASAREDAGSSEPSANPADVANGLRTGFR